MTYTNEEYQIYLKVKHELLLEDARNHVTYALADARDVYSDEIDENELNQFDFEELVELYEEKTAYFDPTNETWVGIAESAVDDYLDEIGEA